MSIALHARLKSIEHRLEACESAILAMSHKLPQDQAARIAQLEGEIRAMKARMGKIREPVE